MPKYRIETKAGRKYEIDLADGDNIDDIVAGIEADEAPTPAPVAKAPAAVPKTPAPDDFVPVYDMTTGVQTGYESNPKATSIAEDQAAAKREAWIQADMARNKQINGPKDEAVMRALSESRYVENPKAATAVDRAQQYRDKQAPNKNVGDAGSDAAARFDEKLQAKTSKKFATAKPDERGNRIATPYNPNTAAGEAAKENAALDQKRADDYMRERAEGMGSVMRGLSKGALQTKGFAEGLVGFVGDAVGDEDIKQWGINAYNSTMHNVGNIPGKQFTELESASDGATYLAETMSYGAFQAAQAILTGGIGGFLGKQVGKQAIGQVVALAASNVSTEIGMIYGDAQEEAARTGKPPPSLAQIAAGAVAAAAIDTFADKFGMDAMTRTGFKGNILSRVAKSVGLQAAVQGGTEMAQKVPEEMGAGKDPFRKGILNDYINEGVAGAVMGGGPGVAGGIRSNNPNDQIARAIQENVDSTSFTDAGDVARAQLSPVNGTPPQQTARTSEDVGPSAQPRLTSFTPADSLTTAAGLPPIVVPEVVRPKGEQDASTDSDVGAVAPGRGEPAGRDIPGSLVSPGLPVVGGLGGMGQPAGLPAAGDGSAGLRQPGAGQQSAPVALPRVADRATDADLLARVTGAVPELQQSAAPAPSQVMMGRSGKGYGTEQDATVALQVGMKREPTLDWKIEPTQDGRLRVAAYERAPDQVAPDMPASTPEATLPDQPPPLPAAALEAAKPPTVQPSGQPFATEKGAMLYAKQQGIEAPVTVSYKGGFAIAPQEMTNGKDNSAASAAVAGEPAAGTELTPGSREGAGPRPVEIDSGNQSQPAAGAPEVSSPPVARPASLRVAPPAPAPVAAKAFKALAKSGRGEVVTAAPSSDAQYAASAIGRILGRTVTFYTPTTAGAKPAPNAFMMPGQDAHIYVATDANDAPTSLVFHEAVHSLPDALKRTLVRQLGKTFDQTKRAEFAAEFDYAGETDAVVDEEIAAFITQAVSGRADFLEQFKAKLKDKEFRGAMDVVLANLKNIVKKLTGSPAYGDAFVKKYVTDVQKAIDLVSSAMAGQANAQAEQVSSVPVVEAEPVIEKESKPMEDVDSTAANPTPSAPDAASDAAPSADPQTSNREQFIPPAFWNRFKVPHDVYIADEDVYETIDLPASKALASAQEDVTNLRALLKCMKG